jgi:hypothetical protein
MPDYEYQHYMNGRMDQELLRLADEVGPTVRKGIVDPASHLPIGRSTQTLCMES